MKRSDEIWVQNVLLANFILSRLTPFHSFIDEYFHDSLYNWKWNRNGTYNSPHRTPQNLQEFEIHNINHEQIKLMQNQKKPKHQGKFIEKNP